MNCTNLKKADGIVKMLKLCNDRLANSLFNVAPDKSGLIPEYSVARLRELGKLLAAEKRTE